MSAFGVENMHFQERGALQTGDLLMQQNTNLKYPDWQRPLQEALVELDKEKLQERLAAVEATIFKRQQAIAHRPDHQDERHALQDALSLLRTLRQAELRYPDWKTPTP